MVEVLAHPENIASLPTSSGVYLFKDADGKVLYVGKAVNLRSRVRSYYSKSGDNRFFIRFLRDRAHTVECVVTANEKEAFLLENELIKRYRPAYNIRLRDDKTYVSLRIRMNHPYPRLEIVRVRRYAGEKLDKQDLYFGPYVSVSAVRATLRFLLKVFPIRTCRDSVFANRVRPCLLYDVGKCCAPCVHPVPKDEYQRLVENVARFLRGRDDEVRALLRKQMEEASEALQFERAALIRDYLRAVDETLERQSMVSLRSEDRDVVVIVSEGGRALVMVAPIRRGSLLRTNDFYLRTFDQPVKEVLSQFLVRHYEASQDIPSEILLNAEPEDKDLLEGWLRQMRGRAVKLRVPRRGTDADLVRTMVENAKLQFEAKKQGRFTEEEALVDLAKRLGLPRIPETIECVDISNTMGALAVGSVVRFEQGLPAREGYRRFRIRTVEGANDFAMMREVLERRFRSDSPRQLPLPDLLIVDGGKGQLSVARHVVEESGASSVMLAALAKARRENRRPGESDLPEEQAEPSLKQYERVFLPHRKNPVVLPPDSAALQLLQQVRDEAHRFAITYHRKLRSKKARASFLTEIPGVGPKRMKALLNHFGSLEQIRAASVDELTQVKGITRRVAEAIVEFFMRERAQGGNDVRERTTPLTDPEFSEPRDESNSTPSGQQMSG
jgi:excinuclease ABC subunit C